MPFVVMDEQVRALRAAVSAPEQSTKLDDRSDDEPRKVDESHATPNAPGSGHGSRKDSGHPVSGQ